MAESKKVAVVTGGAGFIGSHMVDLLVAKDIKVKVLDNFVGGREENLIHHKGNNTVEVFHVDVRECRKSSKIFSGVDYVFHFAGIGDIVPSIEEPSEYMDVNVQGTVAVLESCRKENVKKFVYAASSSCYGIADTPTDESHNISNQYPYALSKYQGEQAALHWNKVYGLPVNVIRIFNAYGPRYRTSGAYGSVIGVFFKQCLENAPLTIVGDGNQSRDFVHVKDVARAFFLAAENNITGQIFNLGAGNPQTVNKLAEMIGGKKISIPNRPGEPRCTWANITKICEVLGWEQQITFADGIKDMLKNIHQWKDAPLWDEKSIAGATEKWFEYLGGSKDKG